MRSMTGYGKGSARAGGREVTVEIKSVNNRFSEINCRVPKIFSGLEEPLKKLLAREIKRGAADIFINYEDAEPKACEVALNTELARAISSASARLSEEIKIENNVDTAFLMRIPEIFAVRQIKDESGEMERLLMEAAENALAAHTVMRLAEGETIKTDLLKLGGSLTALTERARERAPLVVAEYRLKLKNRITEALSGAEPDEARLLTETAFFCDKADINEEISRLNSHLTQYAAALNEEGQAGRKLDFLSQEINREINTMGSKSNDTELTGIVLEMKNELERIKEQIRNVE